MVETMTEIIAGIFVFSVIPITLYIFIQGILIFKKILSAPMEQQSGKESKHDEQDGLDYIERHYGKVRID